MNAPPFDQVMAIYQEFGPNRATPVEERWLQRFPGTPASQLAAWARLCGRIEDAAYSQAIYFASK